MLSQGIAGPRFEKPEEVVEWMGAMQAQDIRAAKWAVAYCKSLADGCARGAGYGPDFASSCDASHVALHSR